MNYCLRLERDFRELPTKLVQSESHPLSPDPREPTGPRPGMRAIM